MFRNHVESWLKTKDSWIVSYVQDLLNNGYDSLTDFEEEIMMLSTSMERTSPKYTVRYMYEWSLRDWLLECNRMYETKRGSY